MHPSASFCFLLFFGFQVFPILKVPQKFGKNYIKNKRPGSFRNHQKREGGDPPRLQAPWWRGPRVGRARDPSGSLVDPLDAPLHLYIALAEETPNIKLFLPISSLYGHRHRFKIGVARRRCPGTLPEGGTTSRSPSTPMDASRICRE